VERSVRRDDPDGAQHHAARAVLASLNISPLYFRFAGGFFMIIPSLFFIFFMRKYLFNSFGDR